MTCRNFRTAAFLVATCLLMTGCAITRKSASVDSVSKTPFFGLELGPKQREPAPETHRIRLEGSIPLEPEPDKLVTPATTKDGSWWQRLKGTEKRTPISIPRTDVVETPPAPQPPTGEPLLSQADSPEF